MSLSRHKEYWLNKQWLLSSISGLAFLVISLSINYIAATYAAINASNPVRDILLDAIPVTNVSLIFSKGAILFVFFITALLLSDPKRTPFMLKSIALFVIIRSIFVMMTHLGPPIDHIIINPNDWIESFTSSNDLFFSGHTGLPFLFALAFWRERTLRIFFIGCSVIAAASVLFGHLHYTIDVFAAFFITYGIFHIAQKLFAKEYHLFQYGLSEKNATVSQ